MRQYDKIVVISLTRICFIPNKFVNNGLKADVIHIQFDDNNELIYLTNDDKTKLNALTENSKLYISAHGTCRMPDLIWCIERKKSVHYQTLAKFIYSHVNPSRVKGLNITLKVCEAGYYSKGTCFATLLLHSLRNLGLYEIHITAHVHKLNILDNSPDTIYCYSDGVRELEFTNQLDHLVEHRNKLIETRYQALDLLLWNIQVSNQLNSAGIDISLNKQMHHQLLATIDDLNRLELSIQVQISETAKTTKTLNRVNSSGKLLFAFRNINTLIIIEKVKYKNWVVNTTARLFDAQAVPEGHRFSDLRSYASHYSFLRKLSHSKLKKIAKDALEELGQEELIFSRY